VQIAAYLDEGGLPRALNRLFLSVSRQVLLQHLRSKLHLQMRLFTQRGRMHLKAQGCQSKLLYEHFYCCNEGSSLK
jgi:hypothetical protein